MKTTHNQHLRKWRRFIVTGSLAGILGVSVFLAAAPGGTRPVPATQPWLSDAELPAKIRDHVHGSRRSSVGRAAVS